MRHRWFLAAALLIGLSSTAFAEDVVWVNAVGASVSGNSVTKTAGTTGWDAGASSRNVLQDGYGYVDFIIPDTGHDSMCGLGFGDGNASYTDVDFAIYFQSGGDLLVYEAGSNRGQLGTYAAGDRMRVEVFHSTIRYRKNGVVFYTSTVAPRFPLRVDLSLYSPGTVINDARVGNLLWASQTGVGIADSSVTKTGPAGWNAGATSANEIVSGDGFMEFTATETSTSRIAGLSNTGSGTGVAGVDFGIHLTAEGTLEVLEGGVSSGDLGSYDSGDRLRVELRGDVVRYYKNGLHLLTSSVSPVYPLRVGAALETPAATLTDVELSPLIWASEVGVSATGNSLRKTADDGWNAGAVSTNELTSGDGFAEFVAVETNKRRTFGLNSGAASRSYADIDFGIDLSSGGIVEVFENGVSKGKFGFYADGDRFRVEIRLGTVRYRKNETVFYSSSATPHYPLHADGALYTSGATLANVSVGDLVWINEVGVQPVAGGLMRTSSGAGWNAGAASSKAVNTGYFEFTAGDREAYRMAGLSHGDSNQTYNDIDFAIHLQGAGSLGGGIVWVYEAGISRGQFGSYAAGDRFRVAVDSGVVTISRNGSVFYTSAVTPVLPLRIDTSLYEAPASLLNATLSGEAVIDEADAPTFSPPAGTYAGDQTVTITSGTLGAVVRFTRDGSDPTERSTAYSMPVSIDVSQTLKAKAWATGWTPSSVSTAVYALGLPTPTNHPMISDPARALALTVQTSLFAPSNTALAEDVVWTNLVGVSASGNSLTRSNSGAAWTMGAASTNVIRDGFGYVEFTATETTTYRICGLAKGDTDQSYTDLDFGIIVRSDGSYGVYEGGAHRGDFSSYSGGDRFRVEVRYGVVRYLKNGVLFYTSLDAPRYPLRVDSSLYSPGATLTDVKVGSVVWANDVGVTVSGSDLNKSGATGWTSGAISANTIEAADGFMEFTASETNTTRVAGLSAGDSDQAWQDIDFGIELRDDAVVEIVESGTSRGTFGSYAADDRLRVELRAGAITYYRNGGLIYSSTVSPGYPLRVDTALYSAGATLADVTLDSTIWTNESGVALDGTTLSKTASDGWNAGASTTQVIDGGDGFVEWIAVESDKERAVGLKAGTDAAETYADIDYAIDLNAAGNVEIFELGTSRGQFGSYAHGDRLRVEIQDGAVRYLRSGTVLYTSAVAPSYPLHGEATLYTTGATVVDLRMGDLVWKNVVGVLPIASGLQATTGACAGAGAVSTRAIDSGYIEFTATGAGTRNLIGLSNSDSSQSWADVDFAILLESGPSLQVHEAGTYINAFGTYAPGDRFRVSIESGVVKYFKNGALIHTSTKTPVLPLGIDTSLCQTSSLLLNTVLSGAAALPSVDAPTITPNSGTYTADQTVTLAAVTGATIRYTVDGLDPTLTSPTYSAPLTINQNLTLKAKTWKSGYQPSSVPSATYAFAVATPTLTPASGSYSGALPVIVATSSPAATIHYRLDGGAPTESDPGVSSGSAVTVENSSSLKANAWRTGWATSATVSATYWISLGTATTPVLSPAPGTYTSAQTVTVTAQSGTTIRFTTDGSDPTFSSTIYAGPIAVSNTTELKAKAFKADTTPSAAAGGLYRIDLGTVDMPRFGRAAGRYATTQYVTITTETSGAVIHFTTNDLEPSEDDPTVVSGGSVAVDQVMVLKAKAWKSGSLTSATRVATFEITGALAVGGAFTLALKADGTVWSWGANAFGQLGDPNLPAQQTTPAQIPGLSDIVAISAGNNHGLALKGDGTVWSWGRANEGQLGRSVPNPAQVGQVDVLTDVVGIAAGSIDSLAIKRDGSVSIWGIIGGYPSGPVQVTGLAGVAQVAVGNGHQLALKTDGENGGTVWAWGQNYGGQLGDGTAVDRVAPVATAGLSSVLAVRAGVQHSLALKADGSVWGWGVNNAGDLGDGTGTPRSTPVLSQGLDSATDVVAGSFHSLALRADGSVWAWGWNAYGQLGTDDWNDASTPRANEMLDAVTLGVASLANHAAAARADGSVWMWGYNSHGELGDGTTSWGDAFPHPIPTFAITSDAQLRADSDGDGLTNTEEYALGTDPRTADTNGDGISDGTAKQAGISMTDTDIDGDGLSNVDEAARGTDPFIADTDGDSVSDGSDCFPLDATRWLCPAANPNDHTPPMITLEEPTNASLISSVPPQ
jgi:alpha-tubulin suppressor-like RCC1 family protein